MKKTRPKLNGNESLNSVIQMLEADCLEQPIQCSDILHSHGMFTPHVKLKSNALEMVSSPMHCDVVVWVLI